MEVSKRRTIKKNTKRIYKTKKVHHSHYLTGTVFGDDVIFLILGIIIGFVIPFLLWLVTVSFFFDYIDNQLYSATIMLLP